MYALSTVQSLIDADPLGAGTLLYLNTSANLAPIDRGVRLKSKLSLCLYQNVPAALATLTNAECRGAQSCVGRGAQLPLLPARLL